MKKTLGRLGKGGGHGAMAGGVAPCDSPERYDALAARFTERFLEQLQRRQPERLRPLLAPESDNPLPARGGFAPEEDGPQ